MLHHGITTREEVRFGLETSRFDFLFCFFLFSFPKRRMKIFPRQLFFSNILISLQSCTRNQQSDHRKEKQWPATVLHCMHGCKNHDHDKNKMTPYQNFPVSKVRGGNKCFINRLIASIHIMAIGGTCEVPCKSGDYDTSAKTFPVFVKGHHRVLADTHTLPRHFFLSTRASP